MAESESLVLIDKVGKNNNIALITLNRQKALNSLNEFMLNKLSSIFKDLKNDKNIRVIIIISEGKSWSAGVDLKWASSLGWRLMKAIRMGQRVFKQIEKHPLPVIAAINGYALGGGMELALSCDVRIAADSAIFGQTETSIGLLPGWGGTYRLPKVIGLSGAKDLIFSSRKFTAEEAFHMNLVSKVVPIEELKNQAIEIAEIISENAPIAVRAAKKAIRKGLNRLLWQGYYAERKGTQSCIRTKDIREGIKAVFEKRKPEFKGK
jgi:enoyl-CoA hydratase/carnithine racemase